MGTPLDSLRNIGPAMTDRFVRIGIRDVEGFRAMGADAAYARMLTEGERPHIMVFTAMVLALQGRDWRALSSADKADIKARYTSCRTLVEKGELPPPAQDPDEAAISPELSAFLDHMGLSPR
ncbi:hypothetical protein PARPLA_01741 [Rhodobacteraceae bacterium THAF1]|uniref:TfoX/Sxy family DNA transformation protein n=1 Tax=Palleronia sp. THAF1 TaxID=2587842 RepID=UPI000F3E3DA4|nr:TfoX/Sxy family DNA transformation protein [Palleronia sp. THAF1]QFU09124.1 hypothetical protein FIU81_10600 [Palleronia sp. THAF1]VDC24068.1 hypothetical protein PARPLA_01741 [Rhodobacteraceae bacterium THAF1]